MINLKNANEELFKQLQVNNLTLLYDIIKRSNFDELSKEQVNILLEEDFQFKEYSYFEKILMRYKTEYWKLVDILFEAYSLDGRIEYDDTPKMSNRINILMELKKFIKDTQK